MVNMTEAQISSDM
jgi:hypothetical protein